MDKEKERKEYAQILDKLRDSFMDRWVQRIQANSNLQNFEFFRTVGTGAFGRVIVVKCKVPQVPLRRLYGILLHGLFLRVPGASIHIGRRNVHPTQENGQIRRAARQVLRGPGYLGARVYAPLLPGLPGPQAGEYPDRQDRIPQDHGLWLRKDDRRSHLDSLRYPGVPGTGDHPVEGIRHGRRLVELRCPGIRDERGLSAILRAKPHEDLRKDRLGEVQVRRTLCGGSARLYQEPPAGGPDQALRKPQGWHERHQEPSLLRDHQFPATLPSEDRAYLHTECRGPRGHQQL